MEVAIGVVLEFWVPPYTRVFGVVRKFNPAGNVVHLKIIGVVPARLHEGTQPCKFKTWSINLRRRIPKLAYYVRYSSVTQLKHEICNARSNHVRDFPYPPGSLWSLLTVDGQLKKT